MNISIRNGEALVELTKPEQKKLGDCTGLVSALATHGCFPSAAVAVKALKQLQEDLERQGEGRQRELIKEEIEADA